MHLDMYRLSRRPAEVQPDHQNEKEKVISLTLNVVLGVGLYFKNC